MNRSTGQAGFTLIEMIVSLALFSVVMTIAVGALLVLIASNQRFQNEQTVMTNLSFALDSMTREIRTGTNYYCLTRDDKDMGPTGAELFNSSDLDVNLKHDCATGRSPEDYRYQGVAFVEGGMSISAKDDNTVTESKKIVYFYDADEQTIFRRVSGQSPQSIVSSGIVITDAEFYVTGSTRLDSADIYQPTVTIVLKAKDSADPTEKTYQVQTTVTQRTLDL